MDLAKPKPKTKYRELAIAVFIVLFGFFQAIRIGMAAEATGLNGYKAVGIAINLFFIGWGTWYYRKNRTIPEGYN